MSSAPSPPLPAAGEEKWGMPLTDLYRLAIAFYKEKNGKILFSYEDNLKLVAFTQQVSHGPYNSATAPPVGVLDVIGRDRRVAWQNLGQITKAQSLEGFVDLLDRLCPQFRAHVEAVKRDREVQQKLREEEAQKRHAELEKERESQRQADQLEESRNREEIQRRELQTALNQQTFHQFKAYAEKQYPGNPEQQAVLIRQLQTEHYHQYMQQLQAQYQDHSSGTGNQNNIINNNNNSSSTTVNGNQGSFLMAQQMQAEGVLMGQSQQQSTMTEADLQNGNLQEPIGDGEGGDAEDGSESGSVIERANMWTRPDMKVFKTEVSAGKGDGVIRVGHGETVTVRVPTHEGGSCLFWEFATDSHDIGFGVYFEWAKPMTTEVSVHISESDDEDDGEDPGEEGDGEYIESYSELATGDDLESGALQPAVSSSVFLKRPVTTIIVPIYRRDCHSEVYAGSHAYPGEGTYLLKFDNSYSLWRSKTLYYRVFYTR